ncbi:helix-turn-helix domain-containing protein [Actinomadura harenae]|uniref:XRE family transcriptional regulator n=1 Tax=Actinomadura harenae TaxID=2483351 RepID=A0A3M2LNQ5_9ACTN|nr:helix-turn-helix transcriptional regulator [Actinomadura harenae]RMI39047.1 XRE family transcriptional regulator [Actinomadura harenae]
MPRPPADLPDPGEDLWASLAALLRLLRGLAAWSQEQTADECNVERQTVGAWEKGRNRIAREHCRKLDIAWRTGGVLEAQRHYAETYEGGPVIGDYIKDEKAARIIRMVTNNVIPGLFQTGAYARALFKARGIQEIDEEVRKWLARQAIISGRGAPNITAFIDQAAFLHPPAPEVMAEQVGKLIDLAGLSNVKLRIIEEGAPWHIGLDGDLTIFSVNGTRRAYITGQLGAQAITGANSADRLEAHWEDISEIALPSDRSLQLLQMIAKELTR